MVGQLARALIKYLVPVYPLILAPASFVALLWELESVFLHFRRETGAHLISTASLGFMLKVLQERFYGVGFGLCNITWVMDTDIKLNLVAFQWLLSV